MNIQIANPLRENQKKEKEMVIEEISMFVH